MPYPRVFAHLATWAALGFLACLRPPSAVTPASAGATPPPQSSAGRCEVVGGCGRPDPCAGHPPCACSSKTVDCDGAGSSWVAPVYNCNDACDSAWGMPEPGAAREIPPCSDAKFKRIQADAKEAGVRLATAIQVLKSPTPAQETLIQQLLKEYFDIGTSSSCSKPDTAAFRKSLRVALEQMNAGFGPKGVPIDPNGPYAFRTSCKVSANSWLVVELMKVKEEHQRSNEYVVDEKYFTADVSDEERIDAILHELAHSWVPDSHHGQHDHPAPVVNPNNLGPGLEWPPCPGAALKNPHSLAPFARILGR